jgi:hypothetical protein
LIQVNLNMALSATAIATRPMSTDSINSMKTRAVALAFVCAEAVLPIALFHESPMALGLAGMVASDSSSQSFPFFAEIVQK